MRVLCGKLDCPVCRQASQAALCTKRARLDEIFPSPSVSLETTLRLNADHRYTKAPNYEDADAEHAQQDVGIYFEGEACRLEYMDIVANVCDMCSETDSHSISFVTFKELDAHMRKQHRRFFCELCLTHLKLFPYERKHYTREELAMHKRNGDRDDFSFRGHPLCEHCDQRFFDRDELYRHFRKDHYFCHFCDTVSSKNIRKNYVLLFDSSQVIELKQKNLRS